MSTLATSPDTLRFISLLDLGFGPSHFVWQDGRIADPCGQLHAPANLSARQAKAAGLLMSGTYGPQRSGYYSMASDIMYQLTVSRLQVLTACNGSTLYALTWKESISPAGVPYWLLRASVRRSSGNERTGWPSPNTPSGGPNSKSTATHTGGMDLEGAATLAGWPAPNTRDHHAQGATHNPKAHSSSLATLVEKIAPPKRGPARLTVSGELLIGSNAGMPNGGQLNPEHSLWLMGIPKEWASCAARAMQSLRKSQRHGSGARCE